MRDFKGMKRQRGRNRGGGGGGKQPQNANRAFDSNGPDGVKVRGNAQHVFEKYQQLARDAGSSGDRVLAENYLQHAEHYFRLLRALQPQRPASEILGRDQFASGFDIDFEDETGQAQAEAADEAAERTDRVDGEGGDRDRNRDRDRDRGDRDRDRGDWQGRDRERDGRDRDGRDRDGRDRWRDRDRNRDRDRDRPRAEGDDRPRDDRPRDDRPRDDRPPREDRFRDERPRFDRDERRDRDRDRGDRERPDRDRSERDPAPAEPQGGPVLRDAEGGESQMPAFLQTRAEPRPEGGEDEGGAPRRPRRRRAPRSFEGGDTGPGEGGQEG
jgi:hypothetical protein